eukprot:UN10602
MNENSSSLTTPSRNSKHKNICHDLCVIRLLANGLFTGKVKTNFRMVNYVHLCFYGNLCSICCSACRLPYHSSSISILSL